MINEYYDSASPESDPSFGLDKKNYYLGSVTQVSSREVTIQADNLTLLEHRMLRQSDLIPNTINYYVVIDSVTGLFFGRIVQTAIPSSVSRAKIFDERRRDQISVEAVVDVLGYQSIGSESFKLPGFARPGIADKVYIANKAITKHYISSIEVDRAQSDESDKIENFAHLSSFENVPLSLHTSVLFDRHLLIVGTTNSGKSTTALSILNQLIKLKKKVLLIDPTGEYRYSFSCEEMEKLILGDNAVVDSGALSVLNWAKIFDCNENTQEATLSGAIQSLRYQKKIGESNSVLIKKGQSVSSIQGKLAQVGKDDTSFNVELLPKQLTEEAVQVTRDGERYEENSFMINNFEWLRQKVKNQLDNTSFMSFVTMANEDCVDLFKALDDFYNTPGQSLYIDASNIGTSDGVGGMVIDLITNYLLEKERCEGHGYVIFVDEVHRYAKKKTEPDSFYSGLTSIAREGRKKGIFLFLTTQNPNDVSAELLGQIGTIITHRLTHSKEIDAIQNSLSVHSVGQIAKLNQGEAILASINLLEDLHLSVDSCSRKHENSTPTL